MRCQCQAIRGVACDSAGEILADGRGVPQMYMPQADLDKPLLSIDLQSVAVRHRQHPRSSPARHARSPTRTTRMLGSSHSLPRRCQAHNSNRIRARRRAASRPSANHPAARDVRYSTCFPPSVIISSPAIQKSRHERSRPSCSPSPYHRSLSPSTEKHTGSATGVCAHANACKAFTPLLMQPARSIFVHVLTG